MQALERVLAILETVAEAGESIAVGEIASQVELPLSTTSRLLTKLADEELVERDGRGYYVLGPRLFELAQRSPQRLNLATVAKPEMSELRDRVEETVSLHVRYGDQRVCVATARSEHPVSRVVPVGLAMPLFGTATGKVLLAHASPEKQRQIMAAEGLDEVEAVRLQAELEDIRERGWELVADEWVEGVTGLSVALSYGHGNTAALSVSGPSSRFTVQRAREVLPMAQDVAEVLSTKLQQIDVD